MTSARRPDDPPEDRRSADAKLSDTETEASTEAQSGSAAAVDADFDALLADVRRERDEYLDIAQRARADFENYRKRASREAQEAERRGKAALATELVPALDNLERALRSAGIDPEMGGPARGSSEPPATDEAATDLPSEEVSAQEAFARGVALVSAELRAAMERAGVETYDPTGETFDPTQHEALSVRPGDDGVAAGTVVETLEKGYRLDGQVLRAARVVVSE
jgi:molecular chaperone GrpE